MSQKGIYLGDKNGHFEAPVIFIFMGLKLCECIIQGNHNFFIAIGSSMNSSHSLAFYPKFQLTGELFHLPSNINTLSLVYKYCNLLPNLLTFPKSLSLSTCYADKAIQIHICPYFIYTTYEGKLNDFTTSENYDTIVFPQLRLVR